MSNTPRNPGGPHQDGCPHQDAVIARFLDGDACPPAQVPNEVLDLHLLDCPDCRLALEQARMLDALVARSADLPGAGEAVEPPGNQPDAARITAWLREAETRATADAGTATTAAAARPRAFTRLLRWAAAAALLALCAVAGRALFLKRRAAPPVSPPSHSASLGGAELVAARPLLPAPARACSDASAPGDRNGPGIVLPDVPAECAAAARVASARSLAAAAASLDVPEQRSAALQARIDRPRGNDAARLVQILMRPDLYRDAVASLAADPGLATDAARLDLQAALLTVSWQALAAEALQQLPGAMVLDQVLAAWDGTVDGTSEGGTAATRALQVLARRGDESLGQLRTRLRTGTAASAAAAARVGLRLDAQALRGDLLAAWLRTQFDADLAAVLAAELRARPGEEILTVAFQAALAAATGATPQEAHVRWFARLPGTLAASVAARSEHARAVAERILCLRVLGATGDDRWLATLRTAAESRHMDERVAGHLALRDLGTRAAAATLIELAERSRHPWTAVASLLTAHTDLLRSEGLSRAPAGTPAWPGGHAGPDALSNLELQLGRLARRGP